MLINLIFTLSDDYCIVGDVFRFDHTAGWSPVPFILFLGQVSMLIKILSYVNKFLQCGSLSVCFGFLTGNV